VKLRKLQSEILGPKNLMGPEKPTLDSNSVYHGGIAFERDPRAIPLKSSSRSYGISVMHQDKPKDMDAPSRSAKVGESGGLDEGAKLRMKILRVCDIKNMDIFLP
jgi:hypothetical protein